MSIRHRFRFAPAVTRLEARETPAAGDLDPTFGNGGIVRLPEHQVTSLAASPDGRVLALTHDPATDTDFVERFDTRGALDATFGTGGRVAIPVPAFTDASVLAALPGGGALVGWEAVSGTMAIFQFARITPAGAVDTSFGTGGTATVTAPGGFADADLSAVVVQPDGRIVVAGDRTFDPLILGQPPRFYNLLVARLAADGQPDPTFGTGGTAVVTGGFSSLLAGGLAVQPDGRVVVGGAASTNPRGLSRTLTYGPVAVRLTTGGQPDPTFGNGGYASVGFPQQSSAGFGAVSVLSDGRLLLAGRVRRTTGSAGGGAVRLTAGGQLDPTYGAGGFGLTPATNVVSAITIDSQGRAVFSGPSTYRLTADGAADAGFGAGGQVDAASLFGFDPASEAFSGLATQPDGNILLAESRFGSPVPNPAGEIARLVGSNPPAGFVPAARGTAVVGGPANGTAQVLNPSNGTYANAGTMTPFPGLAGNVRSTTADVTGDGTPDYVTGAGPGGRPQITVFDGKAGTTVADFLAFEPTFAGGVFVAAADLDGDGKAEIVVTPDQGGSSRVVVFSVAPGGAATPRASFFGIDDPAFRGGARAALGDVNKDGTPDLAVAAGFLGGPRTALFNGKTLFTAPARLVSDFFAFPGDDATRLRNGAFVALGDLTGDGFADLIFGGGPGGAPRVFALSGAAVMAQGAAAAQASPVSNFFVGGNTADRGGVRLATTDADGDGRADLLAGSGAGTAGRIRVYLGKTFASSAEPAGAQDVAAFGGAVLADGVYVG